MNKSIFESAARKPPPTDAVNEAGGVAYALSPKAALAQYAVTGCLNGTFYADAETQLTTVLDLCVKVADPEYIAKLAVYAREHGHMKDMPALLCAWLTSKPDNSLFPVYLASAFPRAIDNGKMLANFVQVVRSGVVGRSSLGTFPKRLVREWIERRSDDALFRASVGITPSMADILRLVHPKPTTESRRALFGHLSGRNRPEHAIKTELLPEIVRDLAAFKLAPDGKPAPNVPWQLLTSLPLTSEHWKGIARAAGWQMTRMNLNTFARHGVFDDQELMGVIADRLRSRDAIQKARAFPYQLLAAYLNVDANVPRPIVDALHDAMEIAVENVPTFAGRTAVCVDVSASMHSPVTGQRPGASTKVHCVHVAALMAASILRRNPDAEVVVFSNRVHSEMTRLEPRDTVLTNARRLTEQPAGGTNCSAPIAWLTDSSKRASLVIMVSDYESWCDSSGRQFRATMGDPTQLMHEWKRFRGTNRDARLACIDLQPAPSVQAQSRPDVLNVGGFSDRVFDLIADFARGAVGGEGLVTAVEAVDLTLPASSRARSDIVGDGLDPEVTQA